MAATRRRSISINKETIVRIHVPPDVLAPDVADVPAHHDPQRVESERRLVRDGVLDLARVLQATTGAVVVINPSVEESSTTPNQAVIDVAIDKSAETANGPVGITAPYGQGFRVLVGEHSIALYGETRLGTSYAIYELMDRMGCRWFIPGPLGEVLPPSGPIAVLQSDDRLAPSTSYRAVWFADDAWKRRNRQGGLRLDAGHALELVYLTKEDRAEHPEWTATVHGKPDPGRLKWSSDTVAKRLSERILELHKKNGAASFSISPNDGFEFDESPEDRALDAGDLDPTMGMTSLTDRFLVLGNRIAANVAQQEPNVLLGFLAYVQYTRPPIRERLHPNLVPQIAPITYSRSHPMNDDRVPGNRDLRHLFDAWGKLAHHGTSVYFYGYFLSELVAPNPMLTKWGHDVPYVLAHNVKFWQPETLTNFETSMHAIYMGMRVAFDAKKKPQDIYDDMDAKLYGAAGPAMHRYWQEVDRTWIDVPEYAGGLFGHARRFSPARLLRLRQLLDAAKLAAKTEMERRRIELADDSLSLFEDQMRLRQDFIAGRFGALVSGGAEYRKRLAGLGVKWKDSYAFTMTSYAPDTISATYYDSFVKPVYETVDKIAETGTILSTQRSFRWRAEKSDALNSNATSKTFDDSKWGSTDVAIDSWSALGLHDYLGTMTYRVKLKVPAVPVGKRSFVTLSMVDGAVRVFVNGKEAPYVHEGKEPATPVSVGLPLRFETTASLETGENVLVIVATRQAINELGVGGLMGPVVLHADR